MKQHIVVIGYGYWGPQSVRNLQKIKDTTVSVFEIDKKRRDLLSKEYPHIFQYETFDDVLNDTSLQGAIVATPPPTHYALGKALLESGKHVLIEKPITTNTSDAKKLIAISKKTKKILMVGHTFLYTPSVIKLKQIIQEKKLGEIYYYDSDRLNLGLIQKGTNVLWDLAVHDLSILDFLFDEKPSEITAIGTSYITKDVIEDAVLFLSYPSKRSARIHVSWLSPVKIRNIVIAGAKQMAVYNDVETVEKIKLYDKRITLTKNTVTPFAPAYRHGDIVVPYIEQREGLLNQLEHFISCITEGKNPLSDGESGMRTVTLLEMAEVSIRKKKTIPLSL